MLNKTEERRLEYWERKMVRNIYGGINREQGWRRWENIELERLYDGPRITTYIRAQRIG